MVYANKHNTISELKDEIHQVIHDLPLVQGRNGKWRMSVGLQGVVILLMPLFVMFNKCQPLINLLCIINQYVLFEIKMYCNFTMDHLK